MRHKLIVKLSIPTDSANLNGWQKVEIIHRQIIRVVVVKLIDYLLRAKVIEKSLIHLVGDLQRVNGHTNEDKTWDQQS